VGLHAAGFEVTGCDLESQPEYPFRFVQRDAFSFTTPELRKFDLIWASPPCQGRTAYKRRRDHVASVDTDGMIARARAMLKAADVPYIIENVPGAPLLDPTTLCGSMFGLDVRRHRLFETSFPVQNLKCRHEIWTPRFPPATNRSNCRLTVEIGVWRIPLDIQQRAIGIDWMSLASLSQAIPPAYAKYLAKQFLKSRDKLTADR
jgi:DNA (cytosine-5)-methyltransferase 1